MSESGTNRPRVAFVFAGQGAQYVGMGKDLVESFDEARLVFEEASDALGFDMKSLCFEGPEESLAKTENTQPAVLTVDVACMRALMGFGVQPGAAAGLSLGEYAALVCANAIDFADAVRLVRKRGRFMQEAVPAGMGGMAALLGLSEEEVYAVCGEASSFGLVEPANFNCPGQIVVSGESKAVDAAVRLAKERGAARSTLLPVSGPFHCRLMEPAARRLEAELTSTAFRDPSIPVVANVDAGYVTRREQIAPVLVRQVSSPVLWEQSVRRLVEDGYDLFVELGPGRTLSGFIRRIDRKMGTLNVEDVDSLERAVRELKDAEGR